MKKDSKKMGFAFNLQNDPQEEGMKPFLRWAGGKSRLLPQLRNFVPKIAVNYYEPFLGCGALYFSLLPEQKLSFLSDINADLINCFMIIRSKPKEFFTILSDYEFSKEFYYKIRDKNVQDNVEKAVRFYYLNRTCWNGLYRVNKNGKFNVPMGKFTNHPYILEYTKLLEISNKLQKVNIKCCDFSEAIAECKADDFVYFDPPYIIGHKNNGFAQYNNRVFSWEDQIKLAELSLLLKNKKVNVMISNANHESIIKLYKDNFNIKVINRVNTINSDVQKRGLVEEIIITSYEE